MSQAETDTSSSSRVLYVALAAGGALLVLALLGWLILRPVPKAKNLGADVNGADDSLAQARQGLGRETDLSTCHVALEQLNTYLGQKSKSGQELTPLLPGAELRQLFGLEDDALAELRNESFTRLDGNYLEECLLLRDAAQSMQVAGLPVQPTPLERATTAFAWTVRQIRLVEHNAPVTPPLYALRRGWGSALERSLAFLALLRQVGPAEELQGCLVFCPERKDGTPRLWACGVIVDGGTDVYLFDPRLGLPLPGANGVGVATLAAARKDPKVLGQLTVKDTDRYDVTAELAAVAELRLVCPLSALAPRMRALQDKLLAPSVRVQLTADAPRERERLRKAGGDRPVQAWREPVQGGSLDGPGLLRRFLPPQEGGIDPNNGHLVIFAEGLVPWQDPTWTGSIFANTREFPAQVGLGQRARGVFKLPFQQAALEPHNPRTLILRGHFWKAANALVKDQEPMENWLRERPALVVLKPEDRQWVIDMQSLFAEQERERRAHRLAEAEQVQRRIDNAWNKGGNNALVLDIALSRSRHALVSYLLGLCKHEQAEQLQARVDTQVRGGLLIRDSEREQAQAAWNDAKSGWSRYLEMFPRDAASRTAERLRGRVLMMLGQPEEAARTWENLQAKGLDKVALLYLAQQARKK